MVNYLDLANKSNKAEFKIKYDKSKTLNDQIIYKENNFYLLNVSKTFVNNTYIGVTLFYFTDEKIVHKHFIDKSRYSEELLGNKSKFLSYIKFKKFIKMKVYMVFIEDYFLIIVKVSFNGSFIFTYNIY